jgi:hypothetical protein
MFPVRSVVPITSGGRGSKAAIAQLAAARSNNVAVDFTSDLKAAERVAEPRSRQ